MDNGLKLIAKYAEEAKRNPSTKKTDLKINQRSFGNTPLLLALKTGNIIIAEALSKLVIVLLDLTDSRGLNALHWACMLREDNIINILLKRHESGEALLITEVEEWGGFKRKDVPITPYKLYKNNIELRHFQFVDQVWETGEFRDRDELHIFREVAYTDVIFHMDKLCKNLVWVKWEENKKEDFVTQDDVKFSSSSRMFQHNFRLGYKQFVTARNNKPCDRLLLARLDKNKQFTHDYAETKSIPSLAASREKDEVAKGPPLGGRIWPSCPATDASFARDSLKTVEGSANETEAENSNHGCRRKSVTPEPVDPDLSPETLRALM